MHIWKFSRDYGVFLAHICASIKPALGYKLPVIMLHGMTCSKEEWRGIYEPVALHTGRTVCMYDARNHGCSVWTDTHSVDAMVDDLGNFMTDKKIQRAALVGHCMGGVTAMQFALRNPEKVERLIVEDIGPNSATKENVESLLVRLKVLLQSLTAIPPEADEEAAKTAVTDYILKVQGTPPQQRLFPLRRRNGAWQWNLNAAACMKCLEKESAYVCKMEGQYDGSALFIYGTASPVKVKEQEETIRQLFPNAEFFGVDGADHFVHANRAVFVRKVVEFLSRNEL